MRPHVICHMLSSVDGKIDGSVLQSLAGGDEYETCGGKLNGDAWICGRTTMQQHFADVGPFVSALNTPAGPQPVYVARRSESYAISVDTMGRLRWSKSDIGGDHLICVVCEQARADYLSLLRDRGISYIVCGTSSVDLPRAVELLGEHFGIRTLLLEGGGHINGAFLEQGLVDEVSLLLAPGIDGRHEVPAVFDGLEVKPGGATPLRLKSLDRLANDVLWLRYDVVRP